MPSKIRYRFYTHLEFLRTVIYNTVMPFVSWRSKPIESEDEDEAALDEERRERHSQQPAVAQSDEQADNSQVCLNVHIQDPRLALVPYSQ